ncbi:peptidase inhibitor family I36 protein, partial [Actinoplanes xinjiangensis]|uniref:peptidase inhibitor family I36 protein n=1 Tax=Actinoplanes xinjiangensis TaxID=512350 RepID=UPI003426F128
GPVKAAAVPACASGWLCIFEHINGGGKRLIFKDEYEQELSTYGFDYKLSSWRNNQGSSDSGAMYKWATNSFTTKVNGSLSPGGYASNVGDYWNDQVISIQG